MTKFIAVEINATIFSNLVTLMLGNIFLSTDNGETELNGAPPLMTVKLASLTS